MVWELDILCNFQEKQQIHSLNSILILIKNYHNLINFHQIIHPLKSHQAFILCYKTTYLSLYLIQLKFFYSIIFYLKEVKKCVKFFIKLKIKKY